MIVYGVFGVFLLLALTVALTYEEQRQQKSKTKKPKFHNKVCACVRAPHNKGESA